MIDVSVLAAECDNRHNSVSLRTCGNRITAGPPALHGSEPGQVRKEAAKAILCKCRGPGSPPLFFCDIMRKALLSNTSDEGYAVTRIRNIAVAILMAVSPLAYAVDSMSLEYGHSDSTNANVNLYRLNAQWDWSRKLVEFGNWNLGGYWETTAGYWDNHSAARTHASIVELGFTPVFRIQQTKRSALAPYVEAGVGVHLLSATSLSPQRQFGSSFQFGDHVGLGVRFGDKGQYDVGYRYQHLSNAGIKGPNQGINFNEVRLQYHF